MIEQAQQMLVSLPPAARRFMAENAEGPGWSWIPPFDGWRWYSSFWGKARPDPGELALRHDWAGAWLPASESQVLLVASNIATVAEDAAIMSLRVERLSHNGWAASLLGTPWGDEITHPGTHSGPLVAAVHCYAAAWEAAHGAR